MKRLLAVLSLAACAGTAWGHDYPTVDRVEYVLECLKNNGGEQQYVYKCSCAIDEIAKQMSYDDYVEGSTIARYQGMGGERMGAFRDPEDFKKAAKGFRAIHAAAKKTCGVSK